MSLFARPKTNYGLDTPQTGGVGSGRGSRMFGRPPVPPTVYGRGMMSAEQQRRDHYRSSGNPVVRPAVNNQIPLTIQGQSVAPVGPLGQPSNPIARPGEVSGGMVIPASGSPAGAGYPPMPNAPEGAPANQPYAPMGGSYSPLANLMAQQTARQHMGIAPGGAAPPPVSPWGQVQQNPANTGIDPARIFRYPELAGVASSMGAYQGMANQHDQMAASGALRDRNVGVFEQMGQPNRGLGAARAQADSIIGGASAARPRRLADGSYDTAPVLSPDAAAAQYGNSPLPGAPMVKPRFGQTLQEAQRDYMNIRNTVPGQTQARVNEMLSGPKGNNLSIPGQVAGTYTGRSGTQLAVQQQPDGSVRVQGPQSQSQWGSQLSGLPNADGRTNAEMAKVRRENVAGARQDRRDASIIARAGQLGQRPTQNLGLFKSMQRQGMPVKGGGQIAGGQPGATTPPTVGEAVKGLMANASDPLFAQFNFDPTQATADQWATFLQNPDLAGLSPTDTRMIQETLGYATANGMQMNPGSAPLEVFRAYQSGGPSAVAQALEKRKKKSEADNADAFREGLRATRNPVSTINRGSDGVARGRIGM
jgi:hypothetical protein